MIAPQCVSEVTEPYVRKWHRANGISLQCRSHAKFVIDGHAYCKRHGGNKVLELCLAGMLPTVKRISDAPPPLQTLEGAP